MLFVSEGKSIGPKHKLTRVEHNSVGGKNAVKINITLNLQCDSFYEATSNFNPTRWVFTLPLLPTGLYLFVQTLLFKYQIL